jgi:hypothetical protein
MGIDMHINEIKEEVSRAINGEIMTDTRTREELLARISELEAQLADSKKKESFYYRHRDAVNKYNADRRWYCADCNQEYSLAAKAPHMKSAKHKARVEANANGEEKPKVLGKKSLCEHCDIYVFTRCMEQHLLTPHHKEMAAKCADLD